MVVKEEGEDDDLDLFGSDEEDEEAERIKAQRVQEYTAKKAKKPVLIAKSSIILDVKPVRTQILLQRSLVPINTLFLKSLLILFK